MQVKLTKQMLHAMITEELEEGLRRNPTISPERLHQLRVKFAKQDPGGAGYMQYWMSLGNDTRTDGVVLNVEDMEGILTPEEYEEYKTGWERGQRSEERISSFDPLPPGMASVPGTGRPLSAPPVDFFKRRRGNFNMFKEGLDEAINYGSKDFTDGIAAGKRSAIKTHRDREIKELKETEKEIFASGLEGEQMKDLLSTIREAIKAINFEIIERETEDRSNDFQAGFRLSYGMYWNLDGGVVPKHQVPYYNKGKKSLGPAFGFPADDEDDE